MSTNQSKYTTDAMMYYYEAKQFTEIYNEIVSCLADKDTLKITSNNNPEDETSLFMNEKINVMKNSIISNLNNAIYNYEGRASTYEMPQLSGEDWEKILNNISFTVKQDDKIAFLADNEIAKTVLFQIIEGELEPDEGEIIWGQTITHTYFPKDNGYLFETDENLTEWLRKYSKDPDETYVRSFLGRMLFSGEEALKQASVLSGGEKVRCMLSRMMLANANLLMLDQPTNHLDLESITALNNGLKDFSSNVLFASHDHQFIQTIANRIIDIKEDGSIVDKQTTYDEYLAL